MNMLKKTLQEKCCRETCLSLSQIKVFSAIYLQSFKVAHFLTSITQHINKQTLKFFRSCLVRQDLFCVYIIPGASPDSRQKKLLTVYYVRLCHHTLTVNEFHTPSSSKL